VNFNAHNLGVSWDDFIAAPNSLVMALVANFQEKDKDTYIHINHHHYY
jgi:hypothetical protein